MAELEPPLAACSDWFFGGCWPVSVIEITCFLFGFRRIPVLGLSRSNLSSYPKPDI